MLTTRFERVVCLSELHVPVLDCTLSMRDDLGQWSSLTIFCTFSTGAHRTHDAHRPKLLSASVNELKQARSIKQCRTHEFFPPNATRNHRLHPRDPLQPTPLERRYASLLLPPPLGICLTQYRPRNTPDAPNYAYTCSLFNGDATSPSLSGSWEAALPWSLSGNRNTSPSRSRNGPYVRRIAAPASAQGLRRTGVEKRTRVQGRGRPGRRASEGLGRRKRTICRRRGWWGLRAALGM